jgi:hypothetical protein
MLMHLSRFGLGGLSEVRAHVLLKVEVGKLITLLKVEKGLELSISLDDAAVLRVLELVGADVGVDLLGDLSSGHFSSRKLAEESSKFVGDLGRLDEARRSTVALGALLLLASLVGSFDLAHGLLLKGAKSSLQAADMLNNDLD